MTTPDEEAETLAQLDAKRKTAGIGTRAEALRQAVEAWEPQPRTPADPAPGPVEPIVRRRINVHD